MTSRPEEVAAAERIVLPGVGAFADCRRGLAAVPGLEAALREAVIGARPAVSRHLRRHAADGRARPRIRDRRGPRLDRRRGRRDRAVRPGAEDPAYGLERAASPRGRRIRCSTGSRRARTPISSTAIISGRADPADLLADHRLRRTACRGGRAGQSDRHAISSGKEPDGGTAADREFSCGGVHER